MQINVFSVFLFALITALATGLGALPFLLVREPPRRWLGLANGVAAGLMGAASGLLLLEAAPLGMSSTAGGVLAGVGFVVLSRRFLAGREVRWGELDGADAVRVILVLGVMTMHSVTEGVGVGVSFGGGEALGLYITGAIAVHNIPEGLAISLVLIPHGSSVWKAAGWSVFSSLPQPLMAVPAFLLVGVFTSLLPLGLGFAAGAMIWMVLTELIPEGIKDASFAAVVLIALVSGALAFALQIAL